MKDANKDYEGAVEESRKMTDEQRGKHALKLLEKYATTIGDTHDTNEVWAFLEGYDCAKDDKRKKR